MAKKVINVLAFAMKCVLDQKIKNCFFSYHILSLSPFPLVLRFPLLNDISSIPLWHVDLVVAVLAYCDNPIVLWYFFGYFFAFTLTASP